MAAGEITQITNHEDQVRRFIERLKKDDLQTLAKSYLKQIQDLEDAVFEVILERDLNIAVGVQLDILGKLVGQIRTTSDDEQYRTEIKARIAINLSHSTPEDVLNVVSLILAQSGDTFYIREEPPAQVRVVIVTPLTVIDPQVLHRLLEAADPAGVRLLLRHTNVATNTRLRFTSAHAPFSSSPTGNRGVGSARGFGDVGATHVGGVLVSVIGG